MDDLPGDPARARAGAGAALTARRLAILAIALAVTAFTLLPICDALFDCGCTWPMWGAADHCDIHHPGPPDCPLCTNWVLGALVAGTLFVTYAGALTVVLALIAPRR